MKSTREQALKIAQRLGCYGAHEASDGSWLPCKDEETFIAVSRGEKIPAVKQEKSSVLEYRNAKTASISKSLYPTREEALAASKRNGCSGVRIVKINGGKMYAACMPKNNGKPENTGMISPRKDDWEPLTEGGVIGIDSLPDGSLVSGKNEDIHPIDAKGFVNYVSRSTDPDVYTNPDSARVRARQLGCIGIRSYTANDGKTVYLPCTATPDYNRVMNIRPDGRPKKQRKKDDCGCEEKSLAKTPAPKKDRVIGSKKNRVGSAGSISSAGSIGMDESTVRALSSKVREHNASVKKNDKSDWSKTNLRALKAVYRRGAGAFSVSHRPGMTRNQWAMGRVNAFLRLLMSGSAKASYTTDNDLLPKGHPWKKKGLGSKSLFIDDSEYFAEPIYSANTGRNNSNGKTTRYIVISMPEDSQEKLQ